MRLRKVSKDDKKEKKEKNTVQTHDTRAQRSVSTGQKAFGKPPQPVKKGKEDCSIY